MAAVGIQLSCGYLVHAGLQQSRMVCQSRCVRVHLPASLLLRGLLRYPETKELVQAARTGLWGKPACCIPAAEHEH
jgi:hypothetical protein